MTPTTHARTGPNAPHPIASSPSWLETAIVILRASGQPMSARAIVEAAHASGCAPPSQTRTPAQSVNRDLHAAARRGDTRIVPGPRAGQFHAEPTHRAQRPPAAIAHTGPPRLPIRPLALLIAVHGGLRACGIRHHPSDSLARTRWIARLQRAYSRALKCGYVSFQAADQLAIGALTMHPAEIWATQWWDA